MSNAVSQSFQSLVLDPHFPLFARSFLGLILLAAGVVKLTDRHRFIVIVQRYELLPPRMAKRVGQALPVVESGIGVVLLFGALLRWSALAASGLFFLFCCGVTINLLRGRREISCGCFGTREDKSLSWSVALRNLVFASIAAAIAFSEFAASAGRQSPPATVQVFEQLSMEQGVLTFLAACGALGLWWISSTFLMLRRLPHPGHGCGGCS